MASSEFQESIAALKSNSDALARLSPEELVNTEAQVSRVYASIVLELNKYPHALESYYSRMEASVGCPIVEVLLISIEKQLSEGKKLEDACIQRLTYNLSCVLWFHLINPLSQQRIKGFFTVSGKLSGVLPQILPVGGSRGKESPISSVADMVYLGYLDGTTVRLNQPIMDTCYGFLEIMKNEASHAYEFALELEDLVGKVELFSLLFAQQRQPSKESSIQVNSDWVAKVLKTIATLLQISDNGKLQLSVLMSLDKLGRISDIFQHSLSISSMDGKMIMQALSIFGKLIRPLAAFGLNDALASGLKVIAKDQVHCQDSFPSVMQPDAKSYMKAFTVLLDIIDQNESLNYLENNLVCTLMKSSLVILSKNLKNNSKTEIYGEFNKINTKLSLSALYLSINFFVVKNSSEYFPDPFVFPEIIINNFKLFKLPPLPKPNYFFQDTKSSVYDKSENFQLLLECLPANLYLLSECIDDEFQALLLMKSYSSNDINQKLVFNLINLTFSSLCPTLFFITQLDSHNLICAATETYVYKIINKVLHLSSDNSLFWLSLINFAHDVCFTDITWCPMFEKLFDYLVSNSHEIIGDTLVKSGLEAFVSTFSDGKASLDALRIFLNLKHVDVVSYSTIAKSEYEYLYNCGLLGRKPWAANEQVSLETSSNLPRSPERKHYIVNSARKQSVHVDDFENDSFN